MPKLLIFDTFMLLICEKNVANYNILYNKTISDGGITVDFWLIKVHTPN